MSSTPVLTTSEFQSKVLDSSLPVLIDFGAEWCGPCKAIAPLIDEMFQEFNGKISIYTVDIDQEPSLASQFGVMSIPTLVLVKNGQEVDRQVGSLQKNALKSFIEKHITP